MNNIQLICQRLNEPPFNKNYRLVDFDDSPPLVHLQLLNDIFSTLDPTTSGDVSTEQPVPRSLRMEAFLRMLNCPTTILPPLTNNMGNDNDRTAFLTNLQNGSKKVIYPILTWILQSYNKLKTRAYLGRYLVRFEPPGEFMNDDTLIEMTNKYKGLQNEFKGVHKESEVVKANVGITSGVSDGDTGRVGDDIKKELVQLEDEKRQLKDRLGKLKEQNERDSSFAPMLTATTQMRVEQDEEIRLHEKMKEQRNNLEVTISRERELTRRLGQLKNGAMGDTGNAMEIFKELERDVNETRNVIRVEMVAEKAKIEEAIKRLERMRLEPNRSLDDVENVKQDYIRLERKRDSLREEVERVYAQDSKLGMFRGHANVSGTKLTKIENEVERKIHDMNTVKSEYEVLENKLSDTQLAGAGGGVVGPNGRIMGRDELKNYGNELREKTHRYRIAKNELSHLRGEAVVLNRTENILKGRDRRLEDFLLKEERRGGVEGFREEQSRLEKASEETANLDGRKGETLDEISEIVNSITRNLDEKKGELKPLIKDLKDLRKEYMEAEEEYNDKKSRYDSIAVGLATERSMIENECDELQDECLREESRYHYLNCLGQIAQVNVEKVQMEEKWQAGNGRLLPEFKGFVDLYQNKIAQQENLSKALRKQQKRIKEGEGGNMYQRSLYADLHRLLSVKLKCKMQEKGMGGTGGMKGIERGMMKDSTLYSGGEQLRFD